MIDLNEYIKTKFPSITDTDLIQLMELAAIKQLEKGEIFIREGDLNYTGALVMDGLLRNFHYTENGEEKTVLYVWEGETIASYASVLQNKETKETTEALEPTTLLTLNYADLKKLASINPHFNDTYIRIVEGMLIATIERIDDFTLLNPEQRYLKLLKQQPFLLQRVPQKYLASYLGITHISLSRIRSRVSKKGEFLS